MYAKVIPIEIQKSSLRLFSSIIIFKNNNDIKRTINDFYTNEKIGKYGLFFHKFLSNKEDYYLNIVLDTFHLDKLNKTFWTFKDTIENEKNNTRILYQLLHYLSTYGINIDAKEIPFIPNQNYTKEEDDFNIKFYKIINVLTVDELKDLITKVVNINKGLSKQQISDSINILKFLYDEHKITNQEIISIANRDIKLKLMDILNIVPFDIDEFIHYLCLKLGYRKIKNKNVLNALYISDKILEDINKYFFMYNKELIVCEIAKKFWRNKEYLLSIKKNLYLDKALKRRVRNIINRARKKASILYKPIKQSLIIDKEYNEFKDFIKKEKLANIVKYYYYMCKKIYGIELYFIRNGSFWVNKNDKKEIINDKYFDYKSILFEEISNRLRKCFNGLKLHPNHYIALPTSLTNFIGNIPNFSTYIFKNNSLFKGIGIQWFNYKDDVVDLDLQSILYNKKTKEFYHISWYGNWNKENNENQIIFSGDMTSAPKPYGACEYIGIYGKNFRDILYCFVSDFKKIVYLRDDFIFNVMLFEVNKKIDDVEKFDKELKEKILSNNISNYIETIIPISFNSKPTMSLGIFTNSIIPRFIFIKFSTSFASSIFSYEKDIIYYFNNNLLKFAHNILYLNSFSFVNQSKDGLKFQDLTIDFWRDYFTI